MTFEEATIAADALYRELNATSRALQKYPQGAMGLTPDEVKFSPDFRRDKAAFDAAFKKLRAFNAKYVKTFRKEIQAARRNRGATS